MFYSVAKGILCLAYTNLLGPYRNTLMMPPAFTAHMHTQVEGGH